MARRRPLAVGDVIERLEGGFVRKIVWVDPCQNYAVAIDTEDGEVTRYGPWDDAYFDFDTALRLRDSQETER